MNPDVQTLLGLLQNADGFKVLQSLVGIRYTTTQPTWTPNKDVEAWVYDDGTNYWFYLYADGVWHSRMFGGVESIVAGTGITISPAGGTGIVTINATSISVSVTAGETVAAKDVVSYLPGGTNVDIVFHDLYGADLAIGAVAGSVGVSTKFTAPMELSAFSATVPIKYVGAAPADTLAFKLCADSAGVPGTVIESHNITMTNAYSNVTQAFTSPLTKGTTYHLVLQRSGGADPANYYSIKYSNFFYFSHATYDGGTWTDSGTNSAFNFRITGTYSAGVYKTIDVPNALGIQGNYLGVVTAYAAGTATVMVDGVYTTSGLTAGSDYFVSGNGGVATTGNVKIGHALSATQLSVFPQPTIVELYSANFTIASTPQTFTILTGFQPRAIHCKAIGNVYSSLSRYPGSGLKLSTVAAPSSVGLWDSDTSGVGSTGSVGDIATIGSSKVTITMSATATTMQFNGYLQFES